MVPARTGRSARSTRWPATSSTSTPPELAGTVAGCLDRDPERRPTPAALLAGIAAGMRFEHGDGDGARSLPGPALALIEEHRRRPPAALAPAPDANSTFGSHSSLPTSLPDLVVGPSIPPPRSVTPDPASSSIPPEPVPAHASRSFDRRLLVPLVALAVIVLVGGGILVGTILPGDPATPAAQGQRQGQGRPPNGPPPGPPPSPPNGLDPDPGPPRVTLNQPSGDQDTTPVLSGSGLPRGTTVTVALQGGRTSPYRLPVDRTGTFHYTINQAHEFFAGPIPPGPHVFVVRYPGGQDLRATFEVHP